MGLIGKVRRKPRGHPKIEDIEDPKEQLRTVLNLKSDILEDFKCTETLHEYDILVKQYHKTLNLEKRCKKLLKSNLRYKK